MDGLPGMVERHWVYDHLTVKVIPMKKNLFLLPVLLALAACGAQPAQRLDDWTFRLENGQWVRLS